MLVTIDFHCMDKNHWAISKMIFLCVQEKNESNIALEQHEGK